MQADLVGLEGKRVCVALSGGRDSVCLLHLLLCAAPACGMRVSALTCEHGIRKEASAADEAFVRRLCGEWGVPLRVFRADVPALARAAGQGLEEAGRAFRYACYRTVVEEGEADVVATAHHKDDAAETVLFRLARGTSPAGLDVFPARKDVVRPLKAATRAEIDAYVREHALPFVEDATNADERFIRNRLRRSVLPALEAAVPGAAEHLVAFAARLAEDEAYLRACAERAVVREEGVCKVPVCLEQPLFSRACLIAMAACGIARDYTSAHVKELSALSALQSGRRVSLPQGVRAVREGEYLVFYAAQPFAPPAPVPFGLGTFAVGAYLVTVGEGARAGALRVDLDAFPAGCVLRTRREGDTIEPFGGGTKPLKKFLTQKKIPARTGWGLPLVACGQAVLAVCGTEIADSVKVTQNTVREGFIALARRGEERDASGL